MKFGFGNISFFAAVLHQYQRWGSQLFVYFTSLLIATSIALILDIRFQWAPERVLLHVLPLTVLLLVAVPVLRVITSGGHVARLEQKPRTDQTTSDKATLEFKRP
jgi:hypothetical protein